MWTVLYNSYIPIIFATEHRIFAEVNTSQNISIKLCKSFTNTQMTAHIKILSLDTEEVDRNSCHLLSFLLKTDYVFLKQI